MIYKKYFFIIITFFFWSACSKKDPIDPSTPLFYELKPELTGINFRNEINSSPELNILSYLYFYNGAGVSAADFNNDGLTDLYFTANQTEDKLYINRGDFQFEDVTLQSGINNAHGWTTGVTTVDINNDGLLDIYISKVGNYLQIEGENILYVNTGLIDGIPTFKNQAEIHGIDFAGFSTQAVFFDYDLDSDLDMFLLNHSVHPNQNYGNGKRRMEIDSYSGDKLFENVDGKFVDVSLQSGIFQGKIGYGLGVSVSDINNDGYPDLYIGNDFFENDYFYINQNDKTFKEIISSNKESLGHTTHFSMGNAINDLNNDGKMDIISLDMLPEDLHTYKTSGLEYPYQTYEQYLKNGYAPQFMQNTFHLNGGNEKFHEIGFLSGIAATEWSWCPLVADFDNDGNKDIYITNGILGATNDMDFINFISNEAIQKQLNDKITDKELSFIEMIPEKKLSNYFFKNNGDNTFKNTTANWSSSSTSFSNGATYADLDNDGDLDIVVNNINEAAFVLKNNSEKEKLKNHYLKLKFEGSDKNKFGIGTKIYAYLKDQIIADENYTTRGYLSSVAPTIHIGLGAHTNLDSLEIIWPNGKFQTLKNIDIDQEITVSIKDAQNNYYSRVKKDAASTLENTSPLFSFKHKDESSIEFNRDPLIPYASTNLGPHISVGDINNDGLEDVFICGAKFQASQLLLQNLKGEFNPVQDALFKNNEVNEDVHSIFFDANGDHFIDLLVVSGGNEFKNGNPLKPRLYLNHKGIFVRDSVQFMNTEVNASRVRSVDFDNDGDLDVSITSNLIPWQFGKTPKQYCFENDGLGNFKDVSSTFGTELQNVGNVQDIVWVDLNNDTFMDAVVAGFWMPISIFINDGKKLKLQKNNSLEETNGWWNTIKVEDFDKDGDLDLVAGNWGLNTRLKASYNQPITLYSNDFDDNGTIDPVITYFYQDQETPFASKDELVKQIPFLNKKYLSYSDFAKAKFNELFPVEKMKTAFKKQVFELASCYFENLGNNTFKRHQLPIMTQISSVNDIAIDDFNLDGYFDMLLVGNNYNISTQLGKLDASHGTILLNNKKGFYSEHSNPRINVSGQARNIEKITFKEDIHYIVSINNSVPIFLKKEK